MPIIDNLVEKHSLNGLLNHHESANNGSLDPKESLGIIRGLVGDAGFVEGRGNRG